MNYMGLNIRVVPDMPKMTLAKDVMVSPKFRAEIDAWMLGFFGTTNLIPDGQTYHMPSINVLTMNPRTYASFKGGITKKGGE